MKCYIDTEQLSLIPIDGEEGWYFDTTTFKRPDGTPCSVLVMSDKRGVYIPPPTGTHELPDFSHLVMRVWMTRYIDVDSELPIGRFRDALNRWSVNVSLRRGKYKLTIEAEDQPLAHALLRRLKDRSFMAWARKVKADNRAHKARKRLGRSSRQGQYSKPPGYVRPHKCEMIRIIDRHMENAA